MAEEFYPTFPDPSAQEEAIDSSGDAEVLYKRGNKIMRYKKKTVGWASDISKYRLIDNKFFKHKKQIGEGN